MWGPETVGPAPHRCKPPVTSRRCTESSAGSYLKRELGAVYRQRGRKNATSHRLLDPDEAAGTSELVACCDERMAEASSPEVELSGLRTPTSSS